MTLLRRLIRTSPAEIQFRLRGLASDSLEALRFRAGLERWSRGRLLHILRPLSPDLEVARRALMKADWEQAHSSIRAHLLTRPTRFVVSPAQRREIVQLIRARFPPAASDAAGRAAVLSDRRYPLLGYGPLSFRTEHGDPDWHFDPVHGRRAPLRFWSGVPYLDPGSGDHKVIWELNRHQHWLSLGRAAWLNDDSALVAAFADELGSWLDANPPLLGINWSSMLELAFRALSWIWAVHLFTAVETTNRRPWLVDLLIALDRQLEHIAAHLSVYFSPNTHLLGEGLSLYVAGRSLPELRGAARWEALGRSTLVRESRAQIHADGGHAELSTHYHRYALDFYLLALSVARITGDPIAPAFADVASRLGVFCRAMADEHGRLPTIGDDDGGLLFPMCGRRPPDAADSLGLAAVLLDRPELAVGHPAEEIAWMTAGSHVGPQTSTPAPGSVAFAQSGYVVMRSQAAHAIIDAGPHGFLNAGHAHADALSMVLSVRGRPLLIDPGTSTYVMDARRRDRFRSTAMHNTVVLDGKSQSLPAGPFQWASRTDARLDVWRPSTPLDYLEASHGGYAPSTHRRSVVRFDSEVWLIVDHVLGTGSHRAEIFWHLAQAWSIDDTAEQVVMTTADGARAGIASTLAARRVWYGDEEGIGWCSPEYGQLLPAPVVSFSEERQAPWSMITAIAPLGASDTLSVAPVPGFGVEPDGWHRCGAILTHADTQTVVLFATPLTGEPHLPGGRSVCRVAVGDGVFTTDARAAFLQISRDGRPDRLLAIDVRGARWTGLEAFTVGPRVEASDLHLDQVTLRELSRSAAQPHR